MKMSKNRFISFEGIDFSGKTTQIQLLTEKLIQQGQKVMVIREPGGTVISEHIRNILLNKEHKEMTPICELLLYNAARHQLIKEKIIPALQSGSFVLADRFVDSTTAYQGFGRKISKKLVNEINNSVTRGCMPTITFYLDLKPEDIIDRREFRNTTADRLESTGDKFYQRVYEGYHKIADKNKSRIKILNAKQTIDQISLKIWTYVKKIYHL
jgi:dTMP kinase